MDAIWLIYLDKAMWFRAYFFFVKPRAPSFTKGRGATLEVRWFSTLNFQTLELLLVFVVC